MLAPVLQLATHALHWVPLPVLMLAPMVAGIETGTPSARDREVITEQVRIEQRMSIRIIAMPGTAALPTVFTLPDAAARTRIRERRIGKCLTKALIGGMTVRRDDQLLFYLRDQRVVSATLERSCRAQNFYLGFYMVRSRDGKLCVGRDTLLSRSGVNCKVRQLRELVDTGD